MGKVYRAAHTHTAYIREYPPPRPLGEKVLKVQLSSESVFWMCVVNAIPSGSRSIRKGNVLTAPSLLDESSYFLSVKGDMIEFVPINQLRLLLKPNGKINIQAF